MRAKSLVASAWKTSPALPPLVIPCDVSSVTYAVDINDEKYGYRWVFVSDTDVEDLVVALSSIKDGLDVGGYGARILAAVFRFERSGGRDAYFIYNVKRGLWYPFVPGQGEQVRDNEAELRLKAQLGGELPMEPELERWFPLWGVPR